MKTELNDNLEEIKNEIMDDGFSVLESIIETSLEEATC